MKTLTLLLAAAAAGVASADWPSFRGNPLQTGVSEEPLPADLSLLWSVESKDGITGTPAIAGGRVYVGTLSGSLLCL